MSLTVGLNDQLDLVVKVCLIEERYARLPVPPQEALERAELMFLCAAVDAG